ncbi:MAG TPA: glycosyltransferase [Flavobacterium sp.]
MIPKIIHYCWLSNDKFPDIILKCLKTWKEKLPDYEFVLWDTKRINIEENIWVKQAFEAKKYAFAADYIRLHAVYNYGGIYLDTDVEVLKSFDDLLHLPYFIGTEGNGIIEAGAFGAEKKAKWLEDCLAHYDNKSFINSDGSFNTMTLPAIMMKQIQPNRKIIEVSKEYIFQNSELLKDDNVLYLFPKEFFCAKNLGTGELENTLNTYAIHHFAMSWIPYKDKLLPNLKRKLMSVFGVKIINGLITALNLKKNKTSCSKM